MIESISRFLDNHFKSRGVNSLYIPAILDAEQIKRKTFERADEKIVVMYAGSPGKKDYLREVVEGISLLSSAEREKLELKLFGITDTSLVQTCGVSKETLLSLSDTVKCMGRVSHDTVLENLTTADFTVLLRNPES